MNQLYERNVIHYIIFSFNIKRDLSSDRRSETLSFQSDSGSDALSLRARSAKVPSHQFLLHHLR
ncbi:hypothetical protein B1J94_06405 [Leptospira kirschneri serovar Grippotyphosa]|nr:hypothetical protein B1J94_06405 [Leptospira kirschneri serovar Grippotyphosa]